MFPLSAVVFVQEISTISTSPSGRWKNAAYLQLLIHSSGCSIGEGYIFD